MRVMTVFLVLTASPAMAHHEVVVATSVVPTMLGIASIVSVGIGAFLQKWRGK